MSIYRAHTLSTPIISFFFFRNALVFLAFGQFFGGILSALMSFRQIFFQSGVGVLLSVDRSPAHQSHRV